MKLTGISTRTRIAGLSAGALSVGIAAATVVAPNAAAAPDCSPAGVQNTVRSSIGGVEDYIADRPEAFRLVRAVLSSGTYPERESRAYFTANPEEYGDIRGILAPISENQQVCGTTGLSPQLTSAYNQFLAG